MKNLKVSATLLVYYKISLLLKLSNSTISILTRWIIRLFQLWETSKLANRSDSTPTEEKKSSHC